MRAEALLGCLLTSGDKISGMLSDEEASKILAVAEARSQMREEHPKEYRSAQLLQSLLDGEWFTPRDVSGEQGMHDFDLHLADGRTFAVEVTSDTSQTDTAFQNQVERINPLPAPKLAHSWDVLIESPGKDHTDQAAAGERSKSLNENLPSVLLQVEKCGIFAEVEHVSSDRRPGESEVVDRLRGLGVRSASPREDDTGESRIEFGQAAHSGTVGPDALVDVVHEHLPRKQPKLVNAKDVHGADEAHLFIWLSIGERHRFGRAEALFHVERFGLSELEVVDLQCVDAVWVALDAGPCPDCRHLYPILCLDSDGWHDWRLRRS